MKEKYITLPIDNKTLKGLKSGDFVYITGTLYTMRDAAHKRIIEAINKNKPVPFDLKNASIYYTGPTPAPLKNITFGAAGPTTSDRMDKYTEELLKQGVKILIGKGKRSKGIRKAIKKYKAIYLATIGGAGTYLAEKIKSSKIIAYKDLGTEAIRKIYVEKFPCIIINDIYGNDFYEKQQSVF